MMFKTKKPVRVLAAAFAEFLKKIFQPTTQKDPAPAPGVYRCGGDATNKPAPTPPAYNCIETQRLAILQRLTKGPATVDQLSTDCNAPDPRARVHELRRAGHQIETHRTDRTNPDGSVSRVGLHVLIEANQKGKTINRGDAND